MTARSLYEKATGNICPSNQIAYSEWHVDFCEWMERFIENNHQQQSTKKGLSKVLICPYFGQFPEWMDLFLADFKNTMEPQGYKLLIDTDLPAFKERVKSILDINCPIVRGGAKAWDYRGSLGLLYAEELKGVDYWGHCDFDMVWGHVSKFISDEELQQLDVYSSHSRYVCGCFSLYRNTEQVNELFRTVPVWKVAMTDPVPNGWIEAEYSIALELSNLKYKYDISIQGNPWAKIVSLRRSPDGNLYQQISYEDWQEIGFFHFRHSKKWPL